MNGFEHEHEWQKLKCGLRTLARQEILPRFHHVKSCFKTDGSPVTEADWAMQQATQAFLREHWPGMVFLGEESRLEVQHRALQDGRPCWVLDPLDGTTNFARGFECFAVSLALLMNGHAVLGLVYDPLRDELFAARKGQGAECNGVSLRLHAQAPKLEQSLALVDFKRLSTPLAAELATRPPYASQRNLGSVALDWCWLAAGRADLYLHGGQKLWDYAAGQLIFSEAGGKSCTLEGQSFEARDLQPRSAVAASTKTALQCWLDWLQEV